MLIKLKIKTSNYFPYNIIHLFIFLLFISTLNLNVMIQKPLMINVYEYLYYDHLVFQQHQYIHIIYYLHVSLMLPLLLKHQLMEALFYVND